MSYAPALEVTDRQRSVLEGWVRNPAGTTYRVIERARIVLMSAEGLSIVEQARRLGVDRQRVRRWRKRGSIHRDRLVEAEGRGASDRDLTGLVGMVLSDEQRRGAPATFSAEQLAQIIAVACEAPEESGRPVTHWPPGELAAEVIERGIVASISPRHVDRVLQGGISGRTRAVSG